TAGGAAIVTLMSTDGMASAFRAIVEGPHHSPAAAGRSRRDGKVARWLLRRPRLYDSTTRVSQRRISRERRSAPDPDPVGISRAAQAIQGTEDSGHGRLLRISARRQPRAGRARAGDAPRTRPPHAGRGVPRGAE